MAPVAGELDLRALRDQDATGLLAGIDRAVVWDVSMTTRFRGLTRRDGVLLHGPAGWGEVAPFWNYGPAQCAPWLAAGLELAVTGLEGLATYREEIPTNVTVPEIDAERARTLAAVSGATTAKVKVSGSAGRSAGRDTTATPDRGAAPDGTAIPGGGSALTADLLRLEAVREALGPEGRIRVDVNGGWDLETARTTLPLMAQAAQGLEYAEQPCDDVADLAALRRSVDVPIAADESVRLSADPLAVARLGAADVVVLKVAPLGGVRRALALAERLGLPAVVSSALDTSVGISAGVALAAALPALAGACGLGTVRLLGRDVALPSATPLAGSLPVRPVHVSRTMLGAARADAELTARWQVRLGHTLAALRERREAERSDPARAVAGLPL